MWGLRLVYREDDVRQIEGGISKPGREAQKLSFMLRREAGSTDSDLSLSPQEL